MNDCAVDVLAIAPRGADRLDPSHVVVGDESLLADGACRMTMTLPTCETVVAAHLLGVARNAPRSLACYLPPDAST